MQQALIAMIIGGVFEFHPKLRVGFLEAQNSWVPGLLSRIEWDYPQYRDTHAPYLSLTPREYFRRNCWAAVEGSEPEIEATAGLIGADRMCISTDYPHFDSNFPHVAENLLKNVPREIAAQIFMGGAHLYGFTEADFKKADAAAAHRKDVTDALDDRPAARAAHPHGSDRPRSGAGAARATRSSRRCSATAPSTWWTWTAPSSTRGACPTVQARYGYLLDNGHLFYSGKVMDGVQALRGVGAIQGAAPPSRSTGTARSCGRSATPTTTTTRASCATAT